MDRRRVLRFEYRSGYISLTKTVLKTVLNLIFFSHGITIRVDHPIEYINSATVLFTVALLLLNM
jgi:hypothetical protein